MARAPECIPVPRRVRVCRKRLIELGGCNLELGDDLLGHAEHDRHHEQAVPEHHILGHSLLETGEIEKPAPERLELCLDLDAFLRLAAHLLRKGAADHCRRHCRSKAGKRHTSCDLLSNSQEDQDASKDDAQSAAGIRHLLVGVVRENVVLLAAGTRDSAFPFLDCVAIALRSVLCRLLDRREPEARLPGRRCIPICHAFDLVEEQRQGPCVNLACSICAGRSLYQIEVVALALLLAEEALLLGHDAAKLYIAQIAETHDRCRKGISVRLAVSPKRIEHGGMVIGRHIAEILVVELGAMLALVAQIGTNRKGNEERCKSKRADERDRAHGPGALALGIGLVCPRLLFRHDGIKHLAGALRCAREPGFGEDDARFCILIGADTRHRIDDGRPIEGQARVEWTVAPGTHIRACLDALAGRHRQMDRAGHIVGCHIPAIGDELPVELAYILVALRKVGIGVDDAERRRFILMSGIELDLEIGALIRHIEAAVDPSGIVGELRIDAVLDDTDRGDMRCQLCPLIGPFGQLPVHAVVGAIEVERAVFDDRKRSI